MEVNACAAELIQTQFPTLEIHRLTLTVLLGEKCLNSTSTSSVARNYIVVGHREIIPHSHTPTEAHPLLQGQRTAA